MKKIVFIYISFFIIILGVIGIKDIVNFFIINKANSEFSLGNYSGALDKYKEINEKGISKSNQDILDLNKGISLLKKGEKELKNKNLTGALDNIRESKKFIGEVKGKDNNIQFYKNSISGDNNYLDGIISLLNNDTQKTIDYREKSLENYKNAINTDTKIDKKEVIQKYDYIKKELEKLKKNLKEKEDQNNNGEQGGDKKSSSSGSLDKENKEKNDLQSGNNEKEKPGDIGGKKWTNSGQFNGIGSDEKNIGNNKANQEELNELKNYSDSLKEFQKNNLQYLQRGSPESRKDILDRMMNQFSQDPMFNDIFPSSGSKDW